MKPCHCGQTLLLNYFCQFSNTFQGTAWDVDANIEIEFDDSYITDRRSALEDMRNDVLSGIGGAYVRQLYLKERYNLTDEEAAKWAAPEDDPATEDEEPEGGV